VRRSAPRDPGLRCIEVGRTRAPGTSAPRRSPRRSAGPASSTWGRRSGCGVAGLPRVVRAALPRALRACIRGSLGSQSAGWTYMRRSRAERPGKSHFDGSKGEEARAEPERRVSRLPDPSLLTLRDPYPGSPGGVPEGLAAFGPDSPPWSGEVSAPASAVRQCPRCKLPACRRRSAA
jgi:hypothetical protein